MENEQFADAILSALQQLMEAAGPEWTLQFLEAGMEEAQAGGGEGEPPMDMQITQAPQPRPTGNAFAPPRQ